MTRAVLDTNILAGGPELRRRQANERRAKALLFVASGLTVVILVFLVIRLTIDGLPALSLDFFTNPHRPTAISADDGVGLYGPAGILDAVVATLVLLVLTMLISVPIGVGGAIYLNEYARQGRFKRMIESWIANLAAVPSVVYGLLGLAVFVRFFVLGPNLLAAALTMSLLVLPIIIVASQEALRSVPNALREASDGLGATRWQTVRHHVLPNAIPGILTGNILALSRAAGETAPLLVIGVPGYVTVMGFGPTDLGTPLQVRIFFLAQNAQPNAIELAAGAILVLLVLTLGLNLIAIVLRHRLSKKTRW